MNMIKVDYKQKLGKTTVLSPAHVQQIHHVGLILTDPPESGGKKEALQTSEGCLQECDLCGF